MTREIEFRGFDGKEWRYGDLTYYRKHDVALIRPDNDKHPNRRHFVDADTVGEFTGIYDKNDKKIYEGDIVRWEYPDYDHCTGWRGTAKNICKVTFEYGSFRINAYPYSLGSCEDFFEDKETYGLEVIGNIHENLELLNKE